MIVAILVGLGLVLGIGAVASPTASAATSADGLVTVNARTNTTVTKNTYGDAASYQVKVDLAGIAHRYRAERSSIDWTADVYVTGPGGYFYQDFVWDDSSWQGIWFTAPQPGTYTVKVDLVVNGWTWDSYLGGYYDYHSDLYTRTVKQTFVLKAPAQVKAGTPTIAGTARVGNKLTARPGTWTNGATLKYQWLRNGVAIKGASKATYTLTAADAGKRVSVKITGTRAGYTSATKTSATRAVAKGNLTAAKPAITGTAKVGRKLTATPGNWTAGTKLSYQWLANGKVISGAKAKTFTLTKAQKGKKITVKVTGSKAGYHAVTKASAATRAVTG